MSKTSLGINFPSSSPFFSSSYFLPHPSSFRPFRQRRKGQILIPSLLIIPSLLLFIYLLFETTKISREKIRQQFAVDSAAFIQMGDYTNILNRTAYVNGAFPYRIFKEAYGCMDGCSAGTESHCLKRTDETGTMCEYQMLYDSGVIPSLQPYSQDEAFKDATPLDKEPKWGIAFNPAVRPNMNTNPPAPESDLTLITSDQGVKLNVLWDPAVAIYKFYAEVYTMLGQVEESQMTVFSRLTEDFTFFRKSYYLNANTDACVSNPGACGDDGVKSSGGFLANKFIKGQQMFMWYIDTITLHGKVWTGGLPPYYLGKTIPPVKMNPPGLFQLATFSDDAMRRVGNGYNVYQGWGTEPGSPLRRNYFGVDFTGKAACRETGSPCVHALVTTQCPQLTSGNNCVWPNPTPKYQTRLYP